MRRYRANQLNQSNEVDYDKAFYLLPTPGGAAQSNRAAEPRQARKAGRQPGVERKRSSNLIT